MIPNHTTARLSELDLTIIKSVPPGGNWKDIPEDVPSKRIQQIRESYAAGKGSRSTYYGRLRPTAPSYTISTYFNRPGNGCHIHYEQDRVLSQREAARLQSFPDSFSFEGGQGAVNNQIGNAVPPLLAFQIAEAIGDPAQFVDLFAGAGGLSLGFSWAGWLPLMANDLDQHAAATYRSNVHRAIVEGDITDESVFHELIEAVSSVREEDKSLWVLGGPPCQGFSTAGNRRSMEDPRNKLFERYVAVLRQVRPTGFVFENVTGLLNMERGRVLTMILQEISEAGFDTTVWKLKADHYGVPQRRTRVFVVGKVKGTPLPDAPQAVTHLEGSPDQKGLFEGRRAAAITVAEALSDLPALGPGEDGSDLEYHDTAQTPYQKLMRGALSPAEFIAKLESDR